jgi:RNA polymerase sigma-70 factor, ECF subfamily
MGDEEDEADVVEAARTGDEGAWELLYRRVYPRLHAYLARRVGFIDAEEAVSETMTRAVAGIDGFTLGPSGFDGWVFGIARRVSADHHRRSDRSHRYMASTVIAGGAVGVGPEPGEAILVAEEHDRVRKAFEELNADERELLELRVVGGLTAEEAAIALGKRPGAVRTAQSRALSHLRQILERGNA